MNGKPDSISSNLLGRLDALVDLPVGVTAIADEAIFLDAAAEIRRLQRELVSVTTGYEAREQSIDNLAAERDRLTVERDQLLAAIGEHVTVRSDQYAEIQRLRAALELADRHFRVIYPRGAEEGDYICKAVRDALSGEPTSPSETTAELTEAERLLQAWADPLPPNGRLYWLHVEKARAYFKRRSPEKANDG